MENLGIVGVGAITVICYLVGIITKACSFDSKWIPCVVGVTGGILGVVGMVYMPDFPGADIVTSVAIGIVSGLAATGIDQIGKQLKN